MNPGGFPLPPQQLEMMSWSFLLAIAMRQLLHMGLQPEQVKQIFDTTMQEWRRASGQEPPQQGG